MHLKSKQAKKERIYSKLEYINSPHCFSSFSGRNDDLTEMFLSRGEKLTQLWPDNLSVPSHSEYQTCFLLSTHQRFVPLVNIKNRACQNLRKKPKATEPPKGWLSCTDDMEHTRTVHAPVKQDLYLPSRDQNGKCLSLANCTGLFFPCREKGKTNAILSLLRKTNKAHPLAHGLEQHFDFFLHKAMWKPSHGKKSCFEHAECIPFATTSSLLSLKENFSSPKPVN